MEPEREGGQPLAGAPVTLSPRVKERGSNAGRMPGHYRLRFYTCVFLLR